MWKFGKLLALVLCMAMIFSVVSVAYAVGYYKTTTHSYSCRVHNGCMWIKFFSHGDVGTGNVYDKYFSGNRSHWPNAFRYDNTWSYKVGNTGYAKGTYTIYSSLITQWASIAFSSTSDTITHIY